MDSSAKEKKERPPLNAELIGVLGRPLYTSAVTTVVSEREQGGAPCILPWHVFAVLGLVVPYCPLSAVFYPRSVGCWAWKLSSSRALKGPYTLNGNSRGFEPRLNHLGPRVVFVLCCLFLLFHLHFVLSSLTLSFTALRQVLILPKMVEFSPSFLIPHSTSSPLRNDLKGAQASTRPWQHPPYIEARSSCTRIPGGQDQSRRSRSFTFIDALLTQPLFRSRFSWPAAPCHIHTLESVNNPQFRAHATTLHGGTLVRDSCETKCRTGSDEGEDKHDVLQPFRRQTIILRIVPYRNRRWQGYWDPRMKYRELNSPLSRLELRRSLPYIFYSLR